ncbi:hypothetical protein [Leucobacter sp. BZR 635]
MRPISGRGLLFLLGFVSFLTLALLGPHVHGSDTAPSPVSSAAAAVSTALGEAGVAIAPPAGSDPQPSEASLGVAAACVLVLLVTLVFLATRAAPERAHATRSVTPYAAQPVLPARGLALPLYRLLSISRT